MTSLESLKKYTTVVADTGDIEAIRRSPQDATTNPSLLYHAAQQSKYAHLVEQAAPRACGRGGRSADRRGVHGPALRGLRPRDPQDHPRPGLHRGRRGLSFDTEGTIAKARKLIALYEKAGSTASAILIKIASTWEGIRADEARTRRHPLQPDAAVQLRAGGGLRRGRRDAHLAVRRPDLRLVQEGQGRRRHPGRSGSRRRLGDEDLRLLQEVRLQDPGDGGELPQGRADHALAGCDLLTISPDLLDQLETKRRDRGARA